MKKTNETYMRYAVLISLFGNIVLVSIKASALMMVNSLAIATDLGISVIGLTVSIILYYSIRLANRPADLLHNYGYGKVENVCEGMEGVVLIGVALAICSQAILGFFHPHDIKFPWIGLASSGINLMINFIGAYFIFKMARRSGSPAVYAEGMHYRLEGFISSAIGMSFAVSMILRARGMHDIAVYVDPAAALLVSLWIIIPSFKMARKAFFNLLDATVGEESQMEILKHLSGHLNEFCEFRGLRSRVAGRKKFVEFKLIVPEDISFLKGYKTVERIEQEIQENIPDCEVQITMQPCARDCEFVRNNEPCPYTSE